MMEAVYICWIDSSSVVGDGVWTDREQISPENLKPEYCETVGWVMHETEDFVTIASSYCKHQVHGHMCIPKLAIIDRSSVSCVDSARVLADKAAKNRGIA